jgi:tetratricopeptide (TPR) repeat protein
MMLAREQKSLLVIGHGSGITAGSAALHPVERVDLVEISRAVLEVDPVFAHLNHGVLADPRVHVYVDDARSFLRTSPRTYDVIISEPTNPWIAGVANLFTVEFFREAEAKLNPGGVFCFWFHEYDQNEDTVSLVLRTLHAVFPHVTMFRAHGYADVVALASTERIRIDFAELEERFDRPVIREELARIHILNLVSFLIHHAISQERFAALIGPGPLNTDLRQRLEYEAPRAFFKGEWSMLVSRHDALERSGMGQTDSLLDRYLELRATWGDPVSQAELEGAIFHLEKVGMNRGVARALSVRGAGAPPVGTSTRPARGGVPPTDQLGPEEAFAHAVARFSAGRPEEAIELFRRSLALRPSSGFAQINLALALFATGHQDEAIAVLRAAIPQHPFAHHMKFELGRMLEQRGELEPAREVYRAAAAGEHADSLSRLGDLLVTEGRPEDAMVLYERALVSIDGHPGAAFGLAQILRRYPATRERALKVLANALVHSPGHEDLLQLQYEISSAR